MLPTVRSDSNADALSLWDERVRTWSNGHEHTKISALTGYIHLKLFTRDYDPERRVEDNLVSAFVCFGRSDECMPFSVYRVLQNSDINEFSDYCLDLRIRELVRKVVKGEITSAEANIQFDLEYGGEDEQDCESDSDSECEGDCSDTEVDECMMFHH
jgi:hypothetical protein